MLKVLICGATGFIGRNITLHLSKDEHMDVHAVWHTKESFDIENVTWHQADLRNSGEVEKLLKGYDLVIQAAATTSGSGDIVKTPYIHTTDNAVMNSLLLRAAYDNDIKHFIFFSCTVMYPSSDKPLNESDFNNGENIHPRYFAAAWTKLYIEKMCQFFSTLGKTKHTVIRHSNIYGPYDKFDLKHSHVFGATVNKVLNADKNITIWGKGHEKRDLLYVDDLVGFVLCCIKKQNENYGLYNCGYGQAVSINDLVNLIIKAAGKNISIQHDLDKPSIETNLCLNSKKAFDDLGWKPETSIEDGIKMTLDWYQANRR